MAKNIIGGIYIIENNISRKVYIGKSNNLSNRLNEHKRLLNKNKHHNNHLQSAWNKYGAENFTFRSLLEIPDEKCQNDMEIFFITKLKSNEQEYGYNKTTGGEGGSVNEEVKKKIKLSKRGLKSTLSSEDARHIKMAIYCGIATSELTGKYNISSKVITAIKCGQNFDYIAPELNGKLTGLKEQALNERNEYILNVYSTNGSVKTTSQITGYSSSIVEKCVYKYTDEVNKKREQRQKSYDEVITLHKQGLSANQIATSLNLSLHCVYDYIKGVTNPYNEPSYKKMDEATKEDVINMFNNGVARKDIATHFSVSKNTIDNVINNYKYANTEVTCETKAS